MSTLAGSDRPPLASRIGWAVLLIVAALATGLYWQSQREERTVAAAAGLSVQAVVTDTGVLDVREEMVLTDVEGPTVTRVLVAPNGVVWRGATDDAGQPAPHRTLPVVGGLAVTFPVEEDSAVMVLDYSLQGVTDVGRDAAELAWGILDDRNTLAVVRVEADVSWGGGEAAEIVEVEAPGASATVVPHPDGVRVSLGALPAHHDVEVHAALPLSAVPNGLAGDRLVMEDMAAAGTPGAGMAGGGPWWLPVLASVVFLLGWGVFWRRHSPVAGVGVVVSGVVEGRPSDHSPAELAWLLRRGSTREEDVAATLADLFAREVLVTAAGRWRLASAGSLRDHEQIVVDWLFTGVGSGAGVDPAEVVEGGRREPGRWRETRRTFATAVQRQARVASLVSRRVGDESVLGVGVAAAGVVVAGVVGMALGQVVWGLCVVVGSVAIVFSDTLARWSPEGADLAGRWVAYAPRLPVADMPGHALVLEADGHQDDPVIAMTLGLVSGVEESFVMATSFVAAPRRRARRA